MADGAAKKLQRPQHAPPEIVNRSPNMRQQIGDKTLKTHAYPRYMLIVAQFFAILQIFANFQERSARL